MNSVKSIGAYAFWNCTTLSSINIPNSVSSIGGHAFAVCKSLETVTIPEGITSLPEDCFDGCSRLSIISIPNTVKYIGGLCFSGCTSLRIIDLPDSLISIASQCFRECTALKSITLPSSLRRLGDGCFYGCSSLESIVALPLTPPTCSTNLFVYCDALSRIYVCNEEAEALYKVTAPWSNYFIEVSEKLGIDNPLANNTSPLTPVYDLNGRWMGCQSEFNRLPSGIYLIGGHKVLK